mgnify:CR=1 FL=1
MSGSAPDDPVKATWGKVVALLKDKPVEQPRTFGPARRKQLKARIKENGEAEVLRVMDWWVNSNHPRATFLRDQCGIKTLLQKTNFEEYLEMAHGDANKVHRPQARTNGKAGHQTIREMLAAERATQEPRPPEPEMVVVDFTPEAGEHRG